MNENQENDFTFKTKYVKVLREIRQHIRKSCPESEVLYRYFKKELSDNERNIVAQHVELCPVCLEALQMLEEIEKKEEEMELPENWDKLEREIDARIYAYLNGLKTSVPVQESGAQENRGLLNKSRILQGITFLLILKQRRLAYFGMALAFCLAAIYAYAFLNRPDYFGLAQIKAEKIGEVRGEGIESETLRKGMQLFAQGKYKSAAELLSVYLAAHPDHLQANYIMGLTYLLDAKVKLLGVAYHFDSQKVQQGIKYLKNALSLAADNAFYQEDCLWFLGKAYLMLGDMEKARRNFEQIINLSRPNLFRKDEARKMVQKIDELSRNF